MFNSKAKIVLGAVLLSTLALTGCSSNSDTSKPESSSSQENKTSKPIEAAKGSQSLISLQDVIKTTENKINQDGIKEIVTMNGKEGIYLYSPSINKNIIILTDASGKSMTQPSEALFMNNLIKNISASKFDDSGVIENDSQGNFTISPATDPTSKIEVFVKDNLVVGYKVSSKGQVNFETKVSYGLDEAEKKKIETATASPQSGYDDSEVVEETVPPQLIE